MSISLKTRRMRARGFNRRQASKLGGRYFSGIGNRATLTTALSGANNDITFLARTPGTAGNDITITLAVAGASTPLSVSASGDDITVNVGTNGSSAAISTAKQVIDAINFSSDASLLVWAQNAPASDGTGVVTALSATDLDGAV